MVYIDVKFGFNGWKIWDQYIETTRRLPTPVRHTVLGILTKGIAKYRKQKAPHR